LALNINYLLLIIGMLVFIGIVVSIFITKKYHRLPG